MKFKLTSTAFSPGSPIPKRYTGEGEDLSPPLKWDAVPTGSKEFALICDDPDAPTAEPWIHWVLYGIGADVSELPEGGTAGGRAGKNSWPSGKTTGYRGPLPPPGHGVHHYHFKLYALDSPVSLPEGATKQQLLNAMTGHIVGQAELVGTYERK